jgi:hypothetical protein
MHKPNVPNPAIDNCGYNNFIQSLKQVKKHRPFAETETLPKICQPEDHFEVASPRSSSSSEFHSETSQDESVIKPVSGSEHMISGGGPSVKLSIDEDGQPSSKAFNQLTSKADEQKVNLFYFGTVLVSQEASMLEKLNAISHFKRKSQLPIFRLAAEAVLGQF